MIEKMTILGGGPAGLAASYFARKHEIPFTVFEANENAGGNTRTLRSGDYRFDTGAHRLHLKDPEMTEELKNLLGDELQHLDVPSQIFFRGKWVDFPISPLNLVSSLGFGEVFKASIDFIKAQIRPVEEKGEFESLALNRYGRTIAQYFLLGYSEKLWGLPCDQLSSSISGKRLKGLTLGTFLKEAFFGKSAKTEHLDGAFLYPKQGYGVIADALADYSGHENLNLNSRVTKIHHEDGRITDLVINENETVLVEELISTLPLPLLVHLMEPSLPDEIRELASGMRFREVIVVVLFINRVSITSYATIYFPGEQYPFTRVSEPRNRSVLMAPEGKTSLMVEIPCFKEDEVWSLTEEQLIEMVSDHLIQSGLISEDEIEGGTVHRVPHAYPVLEVGHEVKTEAILDYMGRIENLHLIGRNGHFRYTHLHDMMRAGHDLIEEIRTRE